MRRRADALRGTPDVSCVNDERSEHERAILLEHIEEQLIVTHQRSKASGLAEAQTRSHSRWGAAMKSGHSNEVVTLTPTRVAISADRAAPAVSPEMRTAEWSVCEKSVVSES